MAEMFKLIINLFVEYGATVKSLNTAIKQKTAGKHELPYGFAIVSCLDLASLKQDLVK